MAAMQDEQQFLELSLPAVDVYESLCWYRELGFVELPTGETRPWHYAVVSNGDFCIGLHGGGIEQPGLSFVRPGVADEVLRQEAGGAVFSWARLGSEQFHEAGLADPDGTLAILLEARTFSPPGSDELHPDSCGPLEFIDLPCRDLSRSVDFWQNYGFIAVADDEGEAQLHAPGIALRLREGTRRPVICCRPRNPAALGARMQRAGIVARHGAEGLELTSPEGTRIVLLED